MQEPLPWTLDSVHFNKNCEEARGLKLPLSGDAIEYRLCDVCGFCFAPAFSSWTFGDFEQRIYNDDYEARRSRITSGSGQKRNANLLEQLFEAARNRHMSTMAAARACSAPRLAATRAWPDSRTYDPFVDRDVRVRELGSFDLVTTSRCSSTCPTSRSCTPTCNR